VELVERRDPASRIELVAAEAVERLLALLPEQRRGLPPL
jgi:hypothetical protein